MPCKITFNVLLEIHETSSQVLWNYREYIEDGKKILYVVIAVKI